ncbi:hypothetical protein Q1695_014676 [Nippostrongylus brasiliensis]|nr:hypothetical protein Q1695_014676 [Nippostrongylus brasiliensis]
MRLLLFFLSVSAAGVFSQCIYLQCKQPPALTPCSQCSECSAKGFSFCASGSTLRCGCLSSPAIGCDRVNALNPGDLKTCRLLETVKVPKPVVRPQGLSAVSVVVERFFSEPPFDMLHPSRLSLLVDFNTKQEARCESFHSITGQKWGHNHCALLIRLSIPGVDHQTDDNYYYDDQSALESEFSTEIFEQADTVRFWVEVTVERELKLRQETIRFSSVLRSEVVHFQTLRPPSVSTPTGDWH